MSQNRPVYLKLRDQIAAAIIEGRRYPADIGRPGGAGDEALDQLATDEGAQVGVIENDVQRLLQICIGEAADRIALARVVKPQNVKTQVRQSIGQPAVCAMDTHVFLASRIEQHDAFGPGTRPG